MYPSQKEILKYIVKVEYGNHGEGSGVIVPLKNKEFSYVLTAKHTFGKDMKERGDNYHKIDIKKIEKSKVTLSNPHKINLQFDSVLEINDIDSSLDFVILKIKNNEDINSLEELKIYDGDFEHCLPYGFPNITKEAHTPYEPFECKHKPIVSDTKFEMKVLDFSNIEEKLSTKEAMSGLSGSGVYVKNNEEIALVGIVIKASLNNNVVCLDLRKCIKKINEKIDVPIFFQDEVAREEETINESHIIPRDGYIEPRTVEIKELGIHVAVCPVTFEEYDLFCEDVKRKKPNCYFFPERRGMYPVVNVSWDSAIEYCKWLSSKDTKFEYILPSSNEWDKISKKNAILENKLNDFIWHKKNTKTIQVVGKKRNGLLGIYDMLGNIHEWCTDDYDEDCKIIRGGSFHILFKDTNNLKVDYFFQNESKKELGFRVVGIKSKT